LVFTIVSIGTKKYIEGENYMGTRHFIGVISNGKYKIANYGQWDGYPSGQGSAVIKFLSTVNIDTFKEKLNNCRYIERSELRQLYINAGDDPENQSGFVSLAVGNRFREMYPSLSRDTGSDILNIVYNSDAEVPLWNCEDFLNDELFCEYSYIINLDDGTLRCYMRGKKHVFGEYIFEDLPTVDEMEYDCEKKLNELYKN
jgi:hypothetical protein